MWFYQKYRYTKYIDSLKNSTLHTIFQYVYRKSLKRKKEKSEIKHKISKRKRSLFAKKKNFVERHTESKKNGGLQPKNTAKIKRTEKNVRNSRKRRDRRESFYWKRKIENQRVKETEIIILVYFHYLSFYYSIDVRN